MESDVKSLAIDSSTECDDNATPIVIESDNTEFINSDITISNSGININKPSTEPKVNDFDIVFADSPQDDSVVNISTSEDVLAENINVETHGIHTIYERDDEDFKMDCSEESKLNVMEDSNSSPTFFYHKKTTIDYIAKSLKKRSIRCLNKMRMMEEAKEGDEIQPASPEHAGQHPIKEEGHDTDDPAENGLSSKNGSDCGNNSNEAEVKLEVCLKESNSSSENGQECMKYESNADLNNINEESYSNASSPEAQQNNKRKSDSKDDLPPKRIKTELQDNFFSREKIFSDFMESVDCSSLEQIQYQTEQVLTEIKTLNEVAREKEREWNNIIHLKKLKEEYILRLQRKKQILLMCDRSNNDSLWESQNDNPIKNHLSQSILKSSLSNAQRSTLRIPNIDKNQTKFRNILPRPSQMHIDSNGSGDCRQGSRQRPVLDVQSIIADYRQRHPEVVPRRGRRIRQNNSSDSSGKQTNNGVLNFSSMILGSGAQVRQNFEMNGDLGILLNAIEGNNNDGSKSSTSENYNLPGETGNFKDILAHFAKLSQSEKNELLQNVIKPPPPYPEVTVHPVPPAATSSSSSPTNSLLHGILTKAPMKSKTSFSPTLARLLTAPERTSGQSTVTPSMNNSIINSGNVSITEILSSSKARNEITITPVASHCETSVKGRSHLEDEEAEDSADRLVIDESNEVNDSRRADSNSDAGDEVPPCQGCNQKTSQFVCAGCGNQWYCSRECQVSAWDEHSEVCSG